MNLLGKICIMLILVMSLVFMTLAMAVYSTHKNWEQAHATVKTQLEEEKARNAQLSDRYTRLDAQAKAELNFAANQLGKLEAEKDTLIRENTEIQQALDTLREREREVIALVQAAEENNQTLLKEVADLQQNIQAAQQERDDIWQVAKDRTLQRDETLVDLAAAMERTQQLTREVARYSEFLREKLGLNPQNLPGVAPRVRGEVQRVVRRNRDLLIEVNLGSDDGLQPNHTLEIYRGQAYLGRAEVLETGPDKAVGRVVFLNAGNIKVGDRVATHLRSTS